ncbi:H-type small acid-soluble spore protein [Calderihabitans maritimus]|uniref:Small acid-soluble spore protein, H-type n=1 Tax=Calderihabitans maritimus TaxID=1246530 RepID=A0A1Z5HV69_9FIRM|nr:H-type small acid-soluble spore protein [Calderihabitans maritimus]GAW93412.1 small acid-soluble spore protein, H-type [Calderihabitans maritimus]
MDFKRAQEIINSPETYEVFYKGKPVWINALDPDHETAEVEVFGEGPSISVPVEELEEGEIRH